MRRASALAAARNGLPNALFVWAPVEQLPAELSGVTELHVIMPWGRLLRAMIRADPAVLSQLAAACVPGARLLVALNLHAWHPPVPEVSGAPAPDT
jgi:16S rRNA (adenine(1408)-N(1))-methyltransferase